MIEEFQIYEKNQHMRASIPGRMDALMMNEKKSSMAWRKKLKKKKIQVLMIFSRNSKKNKKGFQLQEQSSKKQTPTSSFLGHRTALP